MADAPDRFSAALRDVLRDIARDDAARAPIGMDARLTAEFHARYPARRGRSSRLTGLAIAAILTAALASSLWVVTRRRPPVPPLPSTPLIEITTAFMPLAYSAVPYTNAHLVRMEVPRAALATFGLLPIDSAAAAQQGTVTADVLVGEDGLARAVRFVRAPRAPGVSP